MVAEGSPRKLQDGDVVELGPSRLQLNGRLGLIYDATAGSCLF